MYERIDLTFYFALSTCNSHLPHIHEKIDFTVEVFIVYKNKVLLRMHDKVKKWLGPGGHIGCTRIRGSRGR